MTLKELLGRLAENGWSDPNDVLICVDVGDGDAYDLADVYDHGNGITLVGDKA